MAHLFSEITDFANFSSAEISWTLGCNLPNFVRDILLNRRELTDCAKTRNITYQQNSQTRYSTFLNCTYVHYRAAQRTAFRLYEKHGTGLVFIQYETYKLHFILFLARIRKNAVENYRFYKFLQVRGRVSLLWQLKIITLTTIF